MTFVKLAYGSLRSRINVNVNLSSREFVEIIQNEIRNIFHIEENEKIEIVEGGIVGRTYCELGEKIPETEHAVINYLTSASAMFYARVTTKIGNDTYIKTNNNDEVVYFKKEGFCNLDNIIFLSKTQLDELRVPVVSQRIQIQALSETCGICYENEVQTICVYQCSHLFCGSCISRWCNTCAICRSPSGR